MNLADAEFLARQLLSAHGLTDWTFRFNRRKRALGMCWYQRKCIELSVHFVHANDEAAVRDTILHEIAHALAGQEAGHGTRWKVICRRIGATAERCDRTAIMPPGKWRAACPNCGKQFARHRRPRRNCRYSCRGCGPEKGLIQFVREHRTPVDCPGFK